MGNPDDYNPVKRLQFLDNDTPKQPLGTIENSRGEPQIMMYDYELLRNFDAEKLKETASKLLNDEMKEYLQSQGYELIEKNDPRFDEYFSMFNRARDEKLHKLGIEALPMEIGSPVIFESVNGDESNPAINVIFALCNETQGNTPILFAHPILVGSEGIEISNQYRTDTNRFQPPMIEITEETLFGYRGIFSKIVSYPVRT